MFKLYNGHCGMRTLNYRETLEHIGARLLASDRHELIAGSMQRTLPDGSTCCCATGCPTNGGEERTANGGLEYLLFDSEYNVLFNRKATNKIMNKNDSVPSWKGEMFGAEVPSTERVTIQNESANSRTNRFRHVIGFLVEELTRLDKEAKEKVAATY